ncbi:hypothetical protein [Agromyces binzhouensis]|uniref:SnoaL-like domain-containing protein n=1 Tax=Agromyces binzhouensis TaxID=1817495 RepID=A0A4Q2JXU2_9MICO|nr:hypothetical protein [Agromyces binzhouensis]RXZ51637.1 hypothetical protein ESO86_01475 [Agromyces binzhouensis]
MHVSEPDDATTPEVAALLDEIYSGYLRGDTTVIDAWLSPAITMFDSAAPDLVAGPVGLERLRAGRAASEQPASTHDAPAVSPPELSDRFVETALTVEHLTIRTIDEVVIATWWLRVDGVDGSGAPAIPELSRNSAVLVRARDGLRIEHLHEDVWQPLGGPVAARSPEHQTR